MYIYIYIHIYIHTYTYTLTLVPTHTVTRLTSLFNRQDEKYKEEFRQREAELLESCTEEEWRRYEAMRTSKFNNVNVKALMAKVRRTQTGTVSFVLLRKWFCALEFLGF